MAKWGKVDFKDLKRLQKKMDKWQQTELEQFCVDCAKELAARLISRAIKLTPVETGELRRSWTLDNQYIHVARKGMNMNVKLSMLWNMLHMLNMDIEQEAMMDGFMVISCLQKQKCK